MPLDRKQLREEFGQLHKDTGDILTKAAAEKRELSAEEKQKRDQQFARMDAITALIADEDRLAKYALASGEADTGAAPTGRQAFDQEQRDGGQKFDAAKYKEAVQTFARTGDISALQKFAVISTTDSSVLLPKQVLQPIEIRRSPDAFRRLLGLFGLPVMESTSAATINLPVGDDTSNVGAAQTEGATSANTDTVPSYSSTLALSGSTVYTSKPMWFSNTQIGNFDFDVFSYALPILQKRIEKARESAATTTLIAGTVGKQLASTTALTYAEWLAFEHSLSEPYRMDAGFVLSDSCFQLARGLVDSNGRPIMDVDPQGTFQYQIHGKPVVVGQYMEATGAVNKIIGAFISAEAIKVLDAMAPRLTRYVADKTMPDQTGFELFQNGDTKFVAGAFKLLKTAAS